MSRRAAALALALLVIACTKPVPYAPPAWQVGQWVEYETNAFGMDTSRVRFSLTGRDTVGGGNLFWLEIAGTTRAGRSIFKMLVPEHLSGQARRVIVKLDDQPAAEMPVETTRQAALDLQLPVFDAAAVSAGRLGIVTLTTRAGKFTTTHAEVRDKSGKRIELWVAPGVPVLGVVKSRAAGQTMQLVGYGLSGAKSEIQ